MNICTALYGQTEKYMAAVGCFFITSIRNNPLANHVLFTDVRDAPLFDFLRHHGVRIEFVPHRFTPVRLPDGKKRLIYAYCRFDIMRSIANNYDDNEIFGIFDSDVVFVNSIERIKTVIDRKGIGGYNVKYPPEHKAIGLSRLDLKQIFSEIDNRAVNGIPLWWGGDFIGGTAGKFKRVMDIFDSILPIHNERYVQGKEIFQDNEHWLMYAYDKLGLTVDNSVCDSMRRIWTRPNFVNYRGEEDYKLDVWHVPSERAPGMGLQKLFEEICNPSSLFWQLPLGQEFARYVGHYFCME